MHINYKKIITKKYNNLRIYYSIIKTILENTVDYLKRLSFIKEFQDNAYIK